MIFRMKSGKSGKKNPTVSDVAKLANVSTATVSRAMNGDPKVLPPTRDKVLAAAESLGYIFNDTARSLKTRKSRTIGFVCPELSNSFLMEIAEGIDGRLNELGYHLLLRHSQNDPSREDAAIRELLARRVDGLILIPAEKGQLPPLLSRKSDIPCLTVDRSWENQPFPAILTNSRQSTFQAVTRFHENFCLNSLDKNIYWGILRGPSGIITARERYTGFEEAMHSLKIEDWFQEKGEFDYQGGYSSMKAIWLRVSSEKKTLNLFISNQFMHLGATEFLLENNIPLEQVRICAFDYSPFHSLFRYARLFIKQPHLEMGNKAVDLMMRMLEQDSSIKSAVLENTLIMG